ncbi:unnamed protein product [Prunus armeniaca]
MHDGVTRTLTNVQHVPNLKWNLIFWVVLVEVYLMRANLIGCVGCANLMAWCSGPRGYALTRDVLLLDALRLCAGVPAWSTVRRDGDEVRIEDG